MFSGLFKIIEHGGFGREQDWGWIFRIVVLVILMSEHQQGYSGMGVEIDYNGFELELASSWECSTLSTVRAPTRQCGDSYAIVFDCSSGAYDWDGLGRT